MMTNHLQSHSPYFGDQLPMDMEVRCDESFIHLEQDSESLLEKYLTQRIVIM